MTEKEKKMVFMIREFPEDLRWSLKIAAAERKQSMASLVISILQQWVEKN